MAGSFKDFDAALRELQGESIEFGLGGKRFTVPLPLPVAPFAEMFSEEKVDEQLVVALRDYLKKVIDPKQVEAFDKAFVESRIDEPTLISVVDWVMNEATGFPMKRRGSSSSQSRRNSQKPKQGSRKQPRKAASSA